MSRPLRVGMIGVGRHARTILLPSIAQIPEYMQVVALATAHEETARAAAAQFHIPAHVGYEALVADPAVEAVLVVGGQHGPAILAALDAGKPVWTETPGIASGLEASQIRKLAQERSLPVQVGFCLRYSPLYQRMQALLEDWRRDDPGPRTYSVRYYPYVGHFYNLLCHFAGPIAAVCALSSPDGAGQIVSMRFSGSETGVLAWQRFANNALPYERLEIAHASGLLVADDGRELRWHRAQERVTNDQLGFATAEASLFVSTSSIPYGRNTQLFLRGYPPELLHFVQCVRSGEPPACDIDDAEQMLLVGQAVQRSAALGAQWVAVEPSTAG